MNPGLRPIDGGGLPLASSLPSVLLAATRDLSNLHIPPGLGLPLRASQGPALAHRTASASLARRPTALGGVSSLCPDTSPSFCLTLTRTAPPWLSVGCFSAEKALLASLLAKPCYSPRLCSAPIGSGKSFWLPRAGPGLPPAAPCSLGAHSPVSSPHYGLLGAGTPALQPLIHRTKQGARGDGELDSHEG